MAFAKDELFHMQIITRRSVRKTIFITAEESIIFKAHDDRAIFNHLIKQDERDEIPRLSSL